MKKQITLSLITAAILGLTGCGGDGKESTQTEEKKTSKVHISVLDATAGYVNSNQIELSFKGLTLLDSNNQEITELNVSSALAQDIVLTLKDIPTTSTDLVILAKAQGYNDGGTSIVISPTSVEQTINLKLTKDMEGKIAEGIVSKSLDISSFLDPTGTVTSEIILENKEANNKPGVKVTIPVGTVLKDNSGMIITNGLLKVIAFDPTKRQALSAYPGGLNVMANATGFTGIDGTAVSGEREIHFKTAGFVDITIQADDGRKVKSFSKEIEIAMQFAVGTTDGSGTVVQVGNAVPIWSYEQTTGKWTYEKDGTAVDLDANDGLIDVVYNVNHLTAWNLDWHYSAVCTANINILDLSGNQALSAVDHLLVDIPTAPIHRTLPNNDPSSNQFLLYNVPLGYPATVTAYNTGGAIIGSMNSADLCAGNAGTGGFNNTVNHETNLTVDITPPPPTDVTMTFSCQNGNIIPGTTLSTIPFEATLSNAGVFTVLDSNGTGQVGITVNTSATYTVTGGNSQANYLSAVDWGNAGNPTSNQVTITSGTNFNQDFVLSNAFCNPTAGTINGSSCTGTGTDEPTTIIGSGGHPVDVAEDSHGNLYISTWNNGILKRDTSGTISTYIAQGTSNMPSATPTSSNDEVSEVSIKKAQGLDLYSRNGQEYLAYVDRDAGCVNAVMLSTNQVVTIAGQCGQQGNLYSTGTDANNSTLVNATDGKMQSPSDVAMFETTAGLVGFISDPNNGRVYMVSLDGHLWSVAGNSTGVGSAIGVASTFTTNIQNALTTTIRPSMLDVDSKGKVIFSESLGHSISSIDNIAYFAVSPLANTIQLQRIAGNNSAGNSGDGALATTAKLRRPMDIEIDNSDNILVADRYNNKVRRIDAITGIIDTVAGTGSPWGGASCGLATQQKLHRPFGLWIQANSDFYLTQFGGTGNLFYNALRHVTY